MYTSTNEYTTYILDPGIIAHYTYPAMQKEQKRRKINTRHELIHDTEQASNSYVALMSPIGCAFPYPSCFLSLLIYLSNLKGDAKSEQTMSFFSTKLYSSIVATGIIARKKSWTAMLYMHQTRNGNK